jgi:hypothetical protein
MTTVTDKPQTVSEADRWLSWYAVTAGVVACLVMPLLGLAYFATGDGAEQLDSSTVRWWAEPSSDALGPLLTWAAPDRVYSTFVQVAALLFPAALLCALHARRARQPRTRVERTAWVATLLGYALSFVGVLVVAVALVPGDPDRPLVDVGYLALMMPGTLLATLGATVLGASLLRGGWQPRPTAYLLAVSFPFWFVVSGVLGHNGLGLLPTFLAWAVFGRSLLAPEQTASR